jgi:hypothetical protein
MATDRQQALADLDALYADALASPATGPATTTRFDRLRAFIESVPDPAETERGPCHAVSGKGRLCDLTAGHGGRFHIAQSDTEISWWNIEPVMVMPWSVESVPREEPVSGRAALSASEQPPGSPVAPLYGRNQYGPDRYGPVHGTPLDGQQTLGEPDGNSVRGAEASGSGDPSPSTAPPSGSPSVLSPHVADRDPDAPSPHA